jgi:hypothetical protein
MGTGSRVYFARAVDGEDKGLALAEARLLATKLTPLGIDLVDPVADEPTFSTHQGDEREISRLIVEHDLRLLRTCRAVLMEMPIGSRTYIGCVCELTYAYLWGIPVIVNVGPTRMHRPWLVYHATAIVHSHEAAVAALAGVL